ncbi:hypothetical protein U9M48_019285 [Paspalum notatum var. saurae]|uniref:Uncharacterized protein n=1 Tax=Paspalum notatum var. saurae TaxID=547442 RepID=A0AAQ3TFB6_PASNO
MWRNLADNASICILVHSFAYGVMHIDPANEELPSEQPLIEEPEDEQEDPLPTADHIAEEAPSNPSEEDGQNQADRTQGHRSQDHGSL